MVAEEGEDIVVEIRGTDETCCARGEGVALTVGNFNDAGLFCYVEALSLGTFVREYSSISSTTIRISKIICSFLHFSNI